MITESPRGAGGRSMKHHTFPRNPVPRQRCRQLEVGHSHLTHRPRTSAPPLHTADTAACHARHAGCPQVTGRCRGTCQPIRGSRLHHLRPFDLRMREESPTRRRRRHRHRRLRRRPWVGLSAPARVAMSAPVRTFCFSPTLHPLWLRGGGQASQREERWSNSSLGAKEEES